MGWGNFVDPREAAAAHEAAEAMAAQRAMDDDRTEALATAIIEGFGLVADAILRAAGMPPLLMIDRPTQPSTPVDEASDDVDSSPRAGAPVYVDQVEKVHVRDDIDDLLDGTETEQEQ